MRCFASHGQVVSASQHGQKKIIVRVPFQSLTIIFSDRDSYCGVCFATRSGKKKIIVWVPILWLGTTLLFFFSDRDSSRSVLNQRSLTRSYKNLIKYKILISSDRDTVYKNFIKHKIFISSDRDTVTPRYQNFIRPAKDTNLIREELINYPYKNYSFLYKFLY